MKFLSWIFAFCLVSSARLVFFVLVSLFMMPFVGVGFLLAAAEAGIASGRKQFEDFF